MNIELDHNRASELLPLYVIGALDADELAALESYLQHHPDLQERLLALEAVIAQMVQHIPPAPLPADARDRLLARVSSDLARTPRVDTVNAPTMNTRATASDQHPLRRRWGSAPPQPAGLPQPQHKVRVSWPARLGWVAAAACLFLALGLLGLNLLQQSRITALSAEVVRLRAINQQIELALQERQHQLALFLGTERNVALAGTDLAPAAQGAFYLSGEEGLVVVQGLTPLPADRTYQLWLVPPNGVPTSVALLPVPSSDLVAQAVPIPSTLRNFAIVDVSIEQAGGSPAITKEAIVLRGTIN